jgi:AcrR family transcriptional regulator
MATPNKKPRRTAERILEVTLDLFNRFGEPNVSTTLISAELNISPGNLYYHYPAKDELINALYGRYEKNLGELLGAADGVRNVEDAWLFFHMLYELIWQCSRAWVAAVRHASRSPRPSRSPARWS